SLSMRVSGWPRARRGAELVFGQQRRALVVEAPAIGLDVVEPDLVGAAGVGLGEKENRSGHARLGLEYAAGQLDHGVELLVFDQHAAEFFVRGAGAEQD